MDEQKLNHEAHVDGKPVAAHANHVREKTHDEPNVSEQAKKIDAELPEAETRNEVSDEMRAAADKVKEQL